MTPDHANEPTPQPAEAGSPESLVPLVEPLGADAEVSETSIVPNAAPHEEIPILPVISNVEATDELSEPMPGAHCPGCGRWVDAAARSCPLCGVPLLDSAQEDRLASSAVLPKRGTLAVLCGFACFLLLGISHSSLLHSGERDDPYFLPDNRELVHLLVEFEGIAIMVVLFTFAAAGRPPRILSSPRRRATTWLLAPFVLVLLLAFNFGYVHVVKQYVGKPPLFEYVDIAEVIDNNWLLILLVCVQPGVVEELFFRHLALGHFRNLMGNHGAVWTSAVLFGAAHIHNQAGLPVLIVVGVGLGYLRLYSGSLLLPMLAHGVHNGVVLAFH
jgi:membrane protease YdiL (CAAX protease family)